MNKSKVFWVAIFVLVFTVPLSQFLSARMLLVVSVFSLFISGSNGEGYWKHWRRSWDLLLYLLVLLIGLIYSENILFGWKVLESTLSFLAIPIIFARITDINEKQKNAIFNAFILGLCLACLICLIYAILDYRATNDIQVFFFYNLTNTIGYQPTYFAYYLIFAITYLLYDFYFQNSETSFLLKTLGILFLFLMLLLTGGQTAFCGLLLVFSFFILKFLTEDKSKRRKIGAGIVVLMLLCMFLTMLVGKGERGISLNDAWDRLVLWDSTIDAIPNLFFGVGTGDYKIVLNEYYLAHNLEKYASESYNSHNQFIQLLFSNGLLGILSLMLIMGRPLYLSVKNHNFLGILLMFPFLIYGVTEVFLGRYQGIVFFAIVHQLCILQVNISNGAKN